MKIGKLFLPGLLGALFALLLFPGAAWCSGDLHMPADQLGVVWVIPFVCMLLSIALGPLTVPHFWEHHFGKVALLWGLAFLVPCGIVFGVQTALYQAWHAIILEYIPFILLLFALFTIAGGVRLTGNLVGTPAVNCLLLIVGAFLASWMGTTGAAMLLIRPLLRANAHRKYRVHTVVFFIFLVANIGGCLTPLGDPPLFLGFLKGVTFFWTMGHLLIPLIFLSICLLVIFFAMDTFLYNKEGRPVPPHAGKSKEKLGLDGKINLIFLAGVIGAVLMSGASLGLGSVEIYHVEVDYQGLLRDAIMVVLALLSLQFTRSETRRLNNFSWAPIMEVAKIFFGIFMSMIPAIAILQAGERGALADVIRMVSHEGQPVNYMYFWLTGALSSFLDNAPTYLVFFNTAGGDAATLMGPMASTLAAISMGAVFMGANTYIGNAPNFMVRSIAQDQGVKMPSFFGYMVWSIVILIPLFIALTFIFIL